MACARRIKDVEPAEQRFRGSTVPMLPMIDLLILLAWTSLAAGGMLKFVNLVFFMVTVLLRVLIRREFAPLLAKFGEAEEFVDTIHLRDLCLWCDRVNAINAILSVLKFFKYVRFSAQLTLPVDVLMLSMTRMAVLSVVIGILLVGCGAGNRPDRITSELVSLARNEVFSARFWTGDHLYARSRGLADPSRRIRSNWTMLNVS